MKKFFVSYLVLLFLFSCTKESINESSLESRASDQSSINLILPLDLLANIPCANGGAGEDVQFSGSLHALFHVSVSASGVVNLYSHFQPMGAKGIGQTTGDVYNATGITQDHVTLKKGIGETFINNFRLIGPGPGNNLVIHETFKVNVNANGELVVLLDHTSVDCK